MSTRSDTVLVSVGAALLGVIGEAASSGLLVPDAAAQLVQPPLRRRDEEQAQAPLLLVASRDEDPRLMAYHRSHRSHSSHRSHYSGSGGSRSYYAPDPSPAPTHVAPVHVAPPRPPKPAKVSFVAYPGGRIFVDGKAAGTDSTQTLTLAAGQHTVRVENRFLGDTTVDVELSAGQTGEVEIRW